VFMEAVRAGKCASRIEGVELTDVNKGPESS